ncbi:MAG: DUF971 domain-containing protein [Planctomycetaceae bacterium]|nr:DUF971 domain-containing protein [Planctomycetaceae bacterium]
MSGQTESSPVPVSLKGDAQGLTIGWNDGVAHRLTWKQLRDGCPCATCRVKSEEGPTAEAKPASLFTILTAAEAQPLRVTAMQPVGNYAYAIQFSDGHSSGIYTFDHLRRLGEETPAA